MKQKKITIHIKGCLITELSKQDRLLVEKAREVSGKAYAPCRNFVSEQPC